MSLSPSGVSASTGTQRKALRIAWTLLVGARIVTGKSSERGVLVARISCKMKVKKVSEEART